jgi:hypothetical protein
MEGCGVGRRSSVGALRHLGRLLVFRMRKQDDYRSWLGMVGVPLHWRCASPFRDLVRRIERPPPVG